MNDSSLPVQTSIWLPRRLHDRLRGAAFTRRRTLSAILREALEVWLQKHPDTGRAPAQPEGG